MSLPSLSVINRDSALHRQPPFPRTFGILAACLALCAAATATATTPRVIEWERGFGLHIPGAPEANMYLWIYEWNMFEAMQPGGHHHGTYRLPRKLDPSGAEGVVDSPELHLTMRAVEDGAELTVRVTNRTEHTWPEISGIIPCWNPGQLPGTNPSMPLSLNPNFSDPWRTRSFYVSGGGLSPLASRAIHFNQRFREMADKASTGGRHLFSNKWPTSDDNAEAGLLVRESEDGQWVTGIAWERFLSVQGHNPWNCMHNCIRVGPLRPGESRTIRGRLYLFRGSKADCLERYRRDFRAGE